MTEHEFGSLTGAYALDALDDAERALFEAHQAQCPDCEREVRGLRAAAAELSHISTTEPPTSLRTEVLASIGRVRPLPPLRATVVDLRPRPVHRWLWQSVAAACVLIAAVAAGWGLLQHRDATDAHAQTSAIVRVLDSPDASTVTGTIGGSGRTTLVYSKDQQRLILIGHSIPAPAAGKTYQLWMITPSGTARSAGVFTPDSGGNLLVQASGDLGNTALIGVSLEPAGGSKQPTAGAIVARMPL